MTVDQKKPLVLYPFLLAVFPVLSLYASNIDQASLSSVFAAGAASVILALVLFGFLSWIMRSPEKAGLVTSICLLAFFSYGHLHGLANKFLVTHLTYRAVFSRLNWAPKIALFLHILLLPLFIVAVLVFTFKLARSKSFAGPSELTKILNSVAAVLVTISLVRVAWYDIHAGNIRVSHVEAAQLGLRNLKYQPDIYYIILDGYARADVLQKYYHYDNSPFIDFLKSKKFRVPEKSSCNYNWTFLSLPSALNFEYLNALAKKMGPDSTDLRIPYEMIKNNRVVHLLRKQGYRFVHFDSTWGATQSNRYADVQISYKKGLFNDEFLRILSQTTMLKVFKSFIMGDLAAMHLYTFEMLARAPAIQGPKFVFVHMVLPHHPFIFNREGKIRKNATLANQFQARAWADKEGYLDQLIFVNRRMRAVIDRILQGSKNPPIIIIQSDHGPQVYKVSRRDHIFARTGILAACHLPGGGNAILYSTMTPVNLFRLILNYYFGAALPLLKDVTYYSEFNRPYKFLFEFQTRNASRGDGMRKVSWQPHVQRGK